MLGWAVRDPEIGSATLLKHLIASAMPAMKREALRSVAAEMTRPDMDRELIGVLEELGFRCVRSIWNVMLDLQAVRAGA